MALANVIPEMLMTGQRMTVEEFLRRWDALPDVKNAELIEGVVYVASPLGSVHGRADIRIHGWLIVYADSTPHVEAGNNGTFFLARSAPQPDSHLRVSRGGSSVEKDGFFHGPPELIAEVPGSSSAQDPGSRLGLYQRARVRKYLTFETASHRVTCRELNPRGIYMTLPIEADGSIRSRVFPGLWLDPAALAENRSLLPMLRKGMRSPDRKTFRARFRAK